MHHGLIYQHTAAPCVVGGRCLPKTSFPGVLILQGGMVGPAVSFGFKAAGESRFVGTKAGLGRGEGSFGLRLNRKVGHKAKGAIPSSLHSVRTPLRKGKAGGVEGWFKSRAAHRLV